MFGLPPAHRLSPGTLTSLLAGVAAPLADTEPRDAAGARGVAAKTSATQHYHHQLPALGGPVRNSSDPPPVAAGPGASAAGRAPSHRSRNGCYTCRRRKVKCDERTPVCIKCEYSDRKCEWPPEDPLIRRKNRSRKMKLHLADAEAAQLADASPGASRTPPTLDERTRRTMRVPLQALQAFAATLPPGKPIRGYDKGFSNSLMPRTLRADMMTDSAFLAPYFPAVDERLIFRHYISRTIHLSIAFDDPKSTWNPWLTVIAPLAFTHLPGVSPAADALRAALLTIGSVHLHYIADPGDQAGASRIMGLARPTLLGLVHKALEGHDGKEMDKHEVELILAALLGCIIASSLAADDGWHPLLESVLSFITQMGGAEALLRDAPRDHLSPARFVLEQLAIRDVFGCLTTEAAPTILRDAFTPWFFEAERWSRADQEWESVERMFGISRGMVDLIARTCSLVSRARGKDAAAAGAAATPRARFEEEAQGILAELKVWDEACNFTPYYPRTQYGNIAHRHAMAIKLLRDVFGVARGDARVGAAARAILELAVEMVVQYGTIVWLTWPIVIAAFQLPQDDELRAVVHNLLSNPGPHSCFDMGAARAVVQASWEYHDSGGHDGAAWVLKHGAQRPFFD